MTKMAAMPMYGKNLKKKYLLWNQKADDLERHWILEYYQVYSNDDLDLIYGKVKFGPLCFCMGK